MRLITKYLLKWFIDIFRIYCSDSLYDSLSLIVEMCIFVLIILQENPIIKGYPNLH